MENLNLEQLSYDELFLQDYTYAGKIAQVLKGQGNGHKTVCPECGVEDFEHTESCSKWKLTEFKNLKLDELSYDQLYVMDFINNYRVARALDARGLSHKTVCPVCHVDDFTHVEGCEKLGLTDHI